MKFIVGSLPYYGDSCPFSAFEYGNCPDKKLSSKCPRYWNKYFICSDDNPHECQYLIEFDKFVRRRQNDTQSNSL